MKLPLTAGQHDALFALTAALAALELEVVLVGGLVPALLIEALEPGVFMEDVRARRTRDCDLVIGIAVGDAGHAQVKAVNEVLATQGWRRGPANQFRWAHDSKLMLDLMPVPTGIEAGVADAVEVARPWVMSDPARFYRGHELALATAIAVELEGAPARTFRIAAPLPMLAMKLQAWADRPERRHDAHDVAFLLRFLSLETLVAAFRAGQVHRPDLVREVLDRLQAFTDPWAPGVRAYASEAFPYRVDDEDTEADRGAVATAARRLVEAMRALDHGGWGTNA